GSSAAPPAEQFAIYCGARRARCARAIGGVVVAVACLSACDGSYDLPADRRWESAHFTYATRASDISVCPDILEPLEENFALLQSYLGFDWPPGVKITYEKMAGQASGRRRWPRANRPTSVS